MSGRYPEWFTPAQRAAAERGYARAVADVAAAIPPEEVEHEDHLDVQVDVATVIASTRDQLRRHAEAAEALPHPGAHR